MNKQRRKMLRAIAADVEKTLDMVTTMMDDARMQVDMIRDDEQDAFDNMPESLQESENGVRSQDALDSLDTVLEDMDSLADLVQGIIDGIQDVIDL